MARQAVELFRKAQAKKTGSGSSSGYKGGGVVPAGPNSKTWNPKGFRIVDPKTSRDISKGEPPAVNIKATDRMAKKRRAAADVTDSRRDAIRKLYGRQK